MKIVIAGCGEVGSSLYQRLKNEGNEICILEQDKDLLEKIPCDKPGFTTLVADVADYLTYSLPAVKNANIFYGVTGLDETNLIACKFAKEAGAQKTICRTDKISLQDLQDNRQFDFLGIDQIVNLNEIAAAEFFRLTHSPNAPEYCPLFDNRFSILGFRICETSAVCNQKIYDILDQICDEKFYLAGLEKKNVTYFHFDDEAFFVEDGDMLYFVCDNNKLQDLRTYLGYKREKEKNIMIYGNSEIGERLAHKSEVMNFNVKYIEPDPKAAHILSNSLKKSMVLNFDGVDEKKMLDEGLEDADYFFAVGEHLSKNICASILATKNKVAYTFCAIPQKEYISICENNSLIFLILCPTLAMADYLYRFSRRREVSGYFSFRNSQVELFEFQVDSLGEEFQKTISELNLPEETRVFLIERNGHFFRPKGAERILPGDRMIIFCHYYDRERIFDLFFGNTKNAPKTVIENAVS